MGRAGTRDQGTAFSAIFEPKHGFERDVPVEAPIVSEDKLVEIRVDVPPPRPPAARGGDQSSIV
jgi:hypothetical protein